MGTKPKVELRHEMRTVLKNLDERWQQAASRELCRNLTQFLDSEHGREITHVLAWASFFPGEPDLATFIDEQADKRRVYLPTIEDEYRLKFIAVGKDWLKAMTEGRYGVPEPGGASSIEYDPELVNETVVLVPGMAFGRDGTRLGRGKGYYDHFLGRSKMTGVLKIGIGWSLQILAKVPTDAHDIRMDLIVTEEGVVPATQSDAGRAI